jgi:FtsX-like permease family
MAEALSRLIPNTDCRLILVIRHRQVSNIAPCAALPDCLHQCCELLLSRGLKRQREFAVRTVLGAERKVLLSQLLAESLLLALCAGAIGPVLARWGVGLFTAVLPQEDLPRAAYIKLDGWVFAFAIAEPQEVECFRLEVLLVNLVEDRSHRVLDDFVLQGC